MSLKLFYTTDGVVMGNPLLFELLQSHSQKRFRPDESSYTSILLTDEHKIVEKTGLSLFEIEEAALLNGIIPERYSRNQKSFSNADQLKLLRSHVAIIGLGGLGGTVTEILARIGIGQLTLVDGDSFDESNLNRQLLSSPAKLCASKAETGQLRVQEINPAVEVKAVADFLTEKNSQAILIGADIAIDCLDTIADRFILEKSCRHAQIPLISAAIGGSTGQATAIFPGDPGLRNIYGEPTKVLQRGIEAAMGTLPFAAVYIAAVECAEAVTILLGKPPELRKKLFLAEVSDHTTELFTLGS